MDTLGWEVVLKSDSYRMDKPELCRCETAVQRKEMLNPELCYQYSYDPNQHCKHLERRIDLRNLCSIRFSSST